MDSEYKKLYSILTEINGTKYIIGLESAAALLGLGNGYVMPLTIFCEKEENITDDIEVVLVDVLDMTNLVTVDGVRCTDIERTICDMLLYHRDKQTIVDSMCDYYFSVGEPESWGILPQFAEQRGVLSLLEDFYEDAISHAEN